MAVVRRAVQIASALVGLGQFHVKEDLSSGYAVDLSIPRARVAIEADGPSHMARTDGTRFLGHTAMKHRHLTALGWKVQVADPRPAPLRHDLPRQHVQSPNPVLSHAALHYPILPHPDPPKPSLSCPQA